MKKNKKEIRSKTRRRKAGSQAPQSPALTGPGDTEIG